MKDQYFPLKDYLDKLLEDGKITKIQYENIFYNNILKSIKKRGILIFPLFSSRINALYSLGDFWYFCLNFVQK